jgi:hypothetical protein
MKASSKNTELIPWLLSPFTYVAGWRSVQLGLAAILIAGLVGSFSQSHFDGVLDIHTGRPAPLWVFLSEGLIDWISLSILLLIFGKMISKTRFRILDLLGTQALARWPTIITSLAAWPGAVRKVASHILNTFKGSPVITPLTTADIAVFAVFILITILVTCWFVLLSYRSFSISCNVKGRKAIGAFIAGILIAEILSKLAIVLLLHNVAGVAL